MIKNDYIKVGPLVSVIITTYNRGQLVFNAIMSVILQTYKNIEILVIDDCSSDNTEAIVLGLINKYKIIKYYRNNVNKGGNYSRNRGIVNACGEFICGLDDDDEFLPNRIELLLMNYSDSFSFISSTMFYYTSTGGLKKTKWHPIISLDKILYYNYVGNQILVKRERINKLGGFDVNLVRYQDYDMWVRLIKEFGPAKIIKIPTQIINDTHSIGINDLREKNLRGALFFYFKHKRIMNIKQRKVQLLKIYDMQNKKISLKRIFTLCTYKNVLLIIKLIIKNIKR